MRRIAAWVKPVLTGVRRYGIGIIALAGFIIHGGTALLRVSTFFPYPRLVDFAAFYASAHALRAGLSPYTLPEEWIETLRRVQGIPFRPPAVYNPPFWVWLVQPFTLLRFPIAAWAWTLLNLALLLWCGWELTRRAGCATPLERALGCAAMLTFGPVALDLTLGQTSVLLLTAALMVGKALDRRHNAGDIAAGLAHGAAFGAKVFPLAWTGALFLLRQWRLAAISLLLAALVGAIGWAVAPEASAQYWSEALVGRVAAAAEAPSIDDQSLISWLDRLLLPQTYMVPGLRVHEPTQVTWTPPWRVNRSFSHALGYVLLGLTFIGMSVVIWRGPGEQRAGGYFLFVLFTLIALPHMERYNHTLLLPAMAWLWGRGRRQRTLAVSAYALAGLARLNHLWAIALPAPWAPLATGFGVAAALALMGGIATTLWTKPPVPKKAA